MKTLAIIFFFTRLVLSQSWFVNGQNADLMLSGVGFNNTGGALYFNHPSGIASDGTRFLLCDRFNNRVLIWNSLPTSWNTMPNLVLGQNSLTSNNSGSSKSELNFPGNVSVAQNGVVTIADTDNDRVLIWRTFPNQNGQAADCEIYLPAISPPGIPIRYGWPWGVWTDGTRLAVVATHGSSILFWNSIPTSNNQLPDYTITNSNFGTPRNISTDGNTFFFVGDHNAKVNGDKPGTFFWNSFPTLQNQTYDFFNENEVWIKGVKLPDGKLVAGGMSSIYFWNTIPVSSAQRPNLVVTNPYYKNGDGPDVVYAGGKLFVNNYNGNNVQIFNSIPTSPNQLPDFALGSSSVSVNTLDSINYIQNPVVATDGKILIASSDFDASLWIWKTIPTISGKAPDVKIPLRTAPLDISPWDNALYKNKIVLAGKNKIAVWNSIPLNGELPSTVYSNSIGNFIFQELKGVALDSSYFYLSNRNGTIGIWQGIPASPLVNPIISFSLPATNMNHIHSDGKYFCVTVQDGNPRGIYVYKVADFIPGVVPSPYKVILSSPQLNLNLPSSAITFNNSFAIANNSNNQVLMWKNVDDAGDTSKVVVLGQTSIRNTLPGISDRKLHMPGSLAASDSTLWVGEFKFSSRILRYRFPNTTRVVFAENNPEKFVLYQNYPNPFNPSTTIVFSLPSGSLVSLKVFDFIGREVAILYSGELPAGTYEQRWDAANLPSGIYFYRLQAGSFSETKKLVLIR